MPNTPAALLLDRYREAQDTAPNEWNDVLATLLAHRSVRAFLPDPVSDSRLRMIIAAAQSASSSSNLQAWSVVAVRDADRRARLAGLVGNQRHVAECPLFLVWLADFARVTRLAESRGERIEGPDYLEALIVGIVDAALAAQNAVVALESLGLGAVYIGGIRNRPEDVAAELGLPPMVFPVFGLCIGTPDPARPAAVKPRLPQQAVLHEEQYDNAVTQDAAGRYDAALREFQAEQGMRVDDWTRIVVNRLRGAASLSGRHRMREALGNLGLQAR
jgi:nitroreductase